MAEEKKAEPKKRRGRPAKQKEPKAEPKEEFKEEKPVYSHESKMRCTAYSKAYPRYLNKRCNAVMKADGTTQGGKIKIWLCPEKRCGRRTQTEGKLI